MYESEAQIFKALGHPARLTIVHALADGELCVCELQKLVGSDMSTISRHLLQLKTAGVLASRRAGNQVLYRLRTPCVLDFFRCVTGVSTAAGEAEATAVRLEIPVASGGQRESAGRSATGN